MTVQPDISFSLCGTKYNTDFLYKHIQTLILVTQCSVISKSGLDQKHYIIFRSQEGKGLETCESCALYMCIHCWWVGACASEMFWIVNVAHINVTKQNIYFKEWNEQNDLNAVSLQRFSFAFSSNSFIWSPSIYISFNTALIIFLRISWRTKAILQNL